MMAELKEESKELIFSAITDVICPCMILINALKK